MTLTKALDMVKKEYDKAKSCDYVRNPLAFALYKVWKAADAEPPKEA